MADPRIHIDITRCFGLDTKKAVSYHDLFEIGAGKQSSQAAQPSLSWLWSSSSSSTDERLYLLLSGTGGPRVSYASESYTKKMLFNNPIPSSTSVQRIPDTFIKKVEAEKVISPPTDDAYCLGMGCGNLGSKLFFVGGQEPQRSEALPRYSLYKYSRRVFVLDAANPSQQSEVPSMQSGKASPLVLTVENSIYVLAGKPVYVVPVPAFEKFTYDKETSKWTRTTLSSPPFLDPRSNYFEDPDYCAHGIIDGVIHISTSSSSFSFDTKDPDPKAEWKPCTLFGDARPWMEDIGQYPAPYEWMNVNYPTDNNNKDVRSCGAAGGAPFNFDGGAVLYKDNYGCVLICIVLSQGVVVAHYLVNGKVELKRTERLKGLEIPTEAISACLADFGQGYLCLVVSSFDHNHDLDILESKISITPFKVSRNNMDEKLKPEVMEKISSTRISNKDSGYQIWRATSCFVIN